MNTIENLRGNENPTVHTPESQLQALIPKSKHVCNYSSDQEFRHKNPETQDGPVIEDERL